MARHPSTSRQAVVRHCKGRKERGDELNRNGTREIPISRRLSPDSGSKDLDKRMTLTMSGWNVPEQVIKYYAVQVH